MNVRGVRTRPLRLNGRSMEKIPTIPEILSIYAKLAENLESNRTTAVPSQVLITKMIHSSKLGEIMNLLNDLGFQLITQSETAIYSKKVGGKDHKLSLAFAHTGYTAGQLSLDVAQIANAVHAVLMEQKQECAELLRDEIEQLSVAPVTTGQLLAAAH